MSDFVLYGLDEAGETLSTERLRVSDRRDLADVARLRLAKFHAIEIWDGPLCIVRLRRKSEEQA